MDKTEDYKNQEAGMTDGGIEASAERLSDYLYLDSRRYDSGINIRGVI